MSFLTKYLDYELPTENLLAWYEFDGLLDSGPNSNNFAFIVQQTPFFDFGAGSFNNDYIQTPFSGSSYSIFFDLERVGNDESVIISQRAGSNLFLGFTKNGLFFVKLISGSTQIVKFFNALKIPKRAIIVFSRDNNQFSLTYYCPLTKKTRTQSVVFPPELSIDASMIQLGVHPFYASPLGISTARFKMYQLAAIDIGVPSFVVTDLCEEIYLGNEAARNDFIFDGVAIKDKNVDFEVEAANNLGDENGIFLTYSNFLGGFTFKDFNLTGDHRFFRNGVQEYPTEYSTHVVFFGQQPDDVVVLDNFDATVTLENTSIIHPALTNSFDYRILNGATATNMKWISSYNFSNKTYTFNPNNWAYEVDLTGFVHPSSMTTLGGVLITPQHILCKNGYHPADGQTVRFFDKGFNIYDRSIVTNQVVTGAPLRVCMLNEPLPSSFSVVRFLPNDWSSLLPTISTAQIPVLIVNNLYDLVIKDLATLSAASSFTFANSTDATRLLFNATIGSSDIGKSICMIFNNQLIFLGFYNSSGTTGDTAHIYKAAINTAILACGGEEYEIKEYSLRRIPLRNSSIGKFPPNGAMFFKNNRRVFPTHVYLTDKDTSFDKNVIFKDEYQETEIDFEFPVEIDPLLYDEELLLFNDEQIIL